MNLLKGLIGAAVGATLGALIWIAIGYFSGFEVGYVAWAVGLLAGIGMQFAGSERLSPVSGAVATVIAVVAVLVAKLAVTTMLIADVVEFTDEDIRPEAIAKIADDVVTEFESQEQTLEWPPDAELNETPWSESYPPNVWGEATSRWEKIPAEEQNARIERLRAEFNERLEPLIAEARQEAFVGSFGVFDLLWFGLAAVTAFKIGSGASSKSAE